MQTSAAANRITTAAHSNDIGLNLSAGQLVVDDWRIRGWSRTASGGAWAAPSTNYSIVSTANGDYIAKTIAANILYNQTKTPYNLNILYEGSGSAYWAYMYQDLGNHTPINMPDGSTASPYVDALTLSATEDLIVWYANQPFGLIDAGIWCQHVYDDGAGHLNWALPVQIDGSSAVDDTNGQSIHFVSFPRIQSINGEVWVIATECILQDNYVTYNLCYYRSGDNGLSWSDRQYLAGTSTDPSESNVGINSFLLAGVPTTFAKADLLNSYLSVSGTNVYLLTNNGHNFVAPATTLVGVTNPSKQIDITANVENWSFNQAAAPTASSGKYTLQNPATTYAAQVGPGYGSEVIVPGARLLHQAGYMTSNGAELITVGTELIETVDQSSAIAKNQFDLSTQDYSAWLRDQECDRYLEYYSPKQATFDQICDLLGFNVIHGTFTTDQFGNMIAGNIDPSGNTLDNVALLIGSTRSDGFHYVRFRITSSLNKHWAGVCFQMDDTGLNFWVVIYNGNTQKFELKHAIPNATGQRLYKYVVTPQQSSTIALTPGTWYWMGWIQHANHTMAWYTTDSSGAPATSWTKVIDYTSPLTPANKVMRSWHAAVGVVGKSTYNPNQQVGNNDSSGGSYALQDGGGNPITVSLKFTTPNAANITLKDILIGAAQDSNPPDLTIGVVTDNGGQPADFTDDANVIFRKSVPAFNYNASNFPGWGGVPATGQTLAANTTYHIVFSPNDTTSGAAKWYAYSQNPTTHPYGTGMSYQSTDGGATWTPVGDTNLALTAVVHLDVLQGLAEFSALRWSSGEAPQTMESISADVAAKASVIGTRFDSFLQSSDLVLGGDGILWQPASFGGIGDMVLDADVTLSGTGYIVLRSSAVNGGAGNGIQVRLNGTNQQLSFYGASSTLLATIDSAQYFTTNTLFHLRVASYNQFVYVYINECLAGGWFYSTFPAAGYIGLDNGTTWTNVRVPDLSTIMSEYLISSNTSMDTALQDLYGRFHSVGHHRGSKSPVALRYRYYIDYAGKLRAGSFSRLSSVDTYQSSTGLVAAEWDLTNRYSIGALIPQGDYYSLHMNAKELDRTGRRNYRQDDYTDAYTNEQAYLAATSVFKQMEELGEEYTLESPAVWAAEREDRITVTNPLDGHSNDFLIHSIDWSMEKLDKPYPKQKLTLRKYVN